MPDPTEELRKKCESRLAGLKTDRYSWWLHWQELATYILPRRYKWLITPNQSQRGSPINGMILDSTGTLAARRLASGMMSGITSPTRPWFKLQIEGVDSTGDNATAVWLSEVETRMMRVFQESNFYTSMAVMYMDLAVFGTGVNIIYEDYHDVIRCFNPCAGEYYLANSDRNAVDTIYREFVQTVTQLIQWFGKDNCSESVQKAYETGGAGTTLEIVVCHAIEPNSDGKGTIDGSFPYREVYWEQGSERTKCLRQRPFHEFPALCPRWDLVSNDAYGRAPAMDALPDIKQLQQETKRKAQAIDKMVNPPLMADMQLKNQPASVLPGGVTFIANLATNAGMKPVYSVMPPVQEIMMDIKEVQKRITEIFFNDVFMSITSLDTVRSAAEIDARRSEQTIMLGPVLERFYNEALDPAVNRTFNVMHRAGLFNSIPGGIPDAIKGKPIQINFVSMLSEAQRAAGTGGMERIAGIVGNLFAVDQTAIDVLNVDEYITEFSSMLGNSPKIIASEDQIAAKRKSRADQIQAQQMAATGLAAAKGANTLSQTDVGSGQNALQAMIGGS